MALWPFADLLEYSEQIFTLAGQNMERYSPFWLESVYG